MAAVTVAEPVRALAGATAAVHASHPLDVTLVERRILRPAMDRLPDEAGVMVMLSAVPLLFAERAARAAFGTAARRLHRAATPAAA